MAQCITCGSELHPERARKYNYCMAPQCQEQNLKGLTMVAIGMNKAADAYLLLDEQTKEELASGKFRDLRRGSFGTSVPSSAPDVATGSPGSVDPARAGDTPRASVAKKQHEARPGRRPHPNPRRPWSKSAERLAVLYNEQGLRPDEIAGKLGLSAYTVTQIILASRNQGKL